MKNMYTVPEGYFASLQQRLERIPQRESALHGVTASGRGAVSRSGNRTFLFQVKVRPYLAAAACLAVVMFATGIILATRQTVDQSLFDSQFFAEIPYTDPYSVFQEVTEQEEYSQDFLAEYIIETGMSVDEFEYLLK